MKMLMFSCSVENCIRFKTDDCAKCKNNRARNMAVDGFVPCEDADFSKQRARNGRYKTKLVGSAEHGGLQCPACGYLNNAYTFKEETNYECEKCGLPLTVRD